MKISAKGRYALLMLVDLAEHRDQGYTSLKEIAERQDISKKYLEQIVIALNPLEIFASTRGVQGGYKLIKDPQDISVWDILGLTEESISSSPACLQENGQCDKEQCATRWVWAGLNEVTSEYLRSISLQDMVNRANDDQS